MRTLCGLSVMHADLSRTSAHLQQQVAELEQENAQRQQQQEQQQHQQQQLSLRLERLQQEYEQLKLQKKEAVLEAAAKETLCRRLKSENSALLQQLEQGRQADRDFRDPVRRVQVQELYELYDAAMLTPDDFSSVTLLRSALEFRPFELDDILITTSTIHGCSELEDIPLHLWLPLTRHMRTQFHADNRLPGNLFALQNIHIPTFFQGMMSKLSTLVGGHANHIITRHAEERRQRQQQQQPPPPPPTQEQQQQQQQQQPPPPPPAQQQQQ